jgi:hypothetical protein
MPFVVTRGGQPVTDLPILVTSTDTSVVRGSLFEESPRRVVLARAVGPGVARVVVSVQDGTSSAADTLIIYAL